MVVIIGGGITGAATAYYLSLHSSFSDNNIKLIDAVKPATCSKAAAFLSESWGDGTKTERIHRKSFELHLELKEELSLKSFREIKAYHRVDLDDLSWNDNKIGRSGSSINLDDNFHLKPGRHALVDPKELAMALIDRSGATFEMKSVTGLEMNEENNTICGIQMEDGSTEQVSKEEPIVFAMGPWTSRLEDWLAPAKNKSSSCNPMPIDGVLSTSIIWNNLTPLGNSPLALFCEEDINGCHLEIFQRLDKSLYVSGLGNSKVLKASLFRGPHRPIPGKEMVLNPKSALCSLEQSKLLSSSDTTETRLPDNIQACIRPISPDGVPIVGKISGNIYVASGGGQWGITWAPLLGQIVASQIYDGEEPPLSSALRPSRFDTLIQRSLMELRAKDAWLT